VFSTVPVEAVEAVLAEHRLDGTINVLPWTGPGDRASKTILGMANWLRTTGGADDAAVSRAMDVIVGSVVLFGLPDSDGGEHAAAFALASACGGVVFDGLTLFDADGSVVATASE